MLNHARINTMFTLAVSAFLFVACAPSSINVLGRVESTPDMQIAPAAITTQTVLPPHGMSTPQSISSAESFGPNQEDFPAGINPLTGWKVAAPALLNVPALLISISHFPPVARPQAGLSFSPLVFEFYITEGMTRFLSTFYGEFPAPEIPITGDCKIRTEPFKQTAKILGNQVWLDKNKNGRQDAGEPGVGGICVNLYDASNQLAQQTITDTNGYYGFNVENGKYTVEFKTPKWLEFTQKNLGDENADSDADPLTGRADADVTSSLLYLDAGLVPVTELIPTPASTVSLPKAEVGPVRSGRLFYYYVSGLFKNSCLIYAFASHEVLALIPKCAMVVHEDSGGGSMLPLDRMKAIADDNARKLGNNFNYASNLFAEKPPAGGEPASQINVFVHLLNQSGWTYDPLYQAWLRSVDNYDKKTPGVLHADVDRLTGRQIHFENFIVIFLEHDVVSPTNLNIHLEQGEEGPAILFRDGMMYKIRWSAKSGAYEKKSGFRKPLQFLNLDGSPAALRPGHTWILVATTYSLVNLTGTDTWTVKYVSPGGAK